MSLYEVIVLAIVQGLAELLPVSSSAHVVVTEKLLGLDPSSPQMTLLLVMLHTGTMVAVIVYFWKDWKSAYFTSQKYCGSFVIRSLWSLAVTAVVGYPIIAAIERRMFASSKGTQIEDIFGRLDLIAMALFAAGIMILLAGWKEHRGCIAAAKENSGSLDEISMGRAGWIGAAQGLSLPFRGFSRSGATISTGLLLGIGRKSAERFSFALAVLLTPPVVGRELIRLLHASHDGKLAGLPLDLQASLTTALLGAVLSFFAGMVALRWLSRWLEVGRWYLFGIYCVAASGMVFYLHLNGY